MVFRRGGGRKRRDANERIIMEALRAAGYDVRQISGCGLPDLLVWRSGRAWVLELKTAKGTRTEAQRAVPWPIVRTVEEAFAEVAR